MNYLRFKRQAACCCADPVTRSRIPKHEFGAALYELAFLIPVMAILLAGVVDVGRLGLISKKLPFLAREVASAALRNCEDLATLEECAENIRDIYLTSYAPKYGSSFDVIVSAYRCEHICQHPPFYLQPVTPIDCVPAIHTCECNCVFTNEPVTQLFSTLGDGEDQSLVQYESYYDANSAFSTFPTALNERGFVLITEVFLNYQPSFSFLGEQLIHVQVSSS